MNRRADRRPTISTRCQESARGATAYQLMKTFLLFWKKRLVAGYLKTFIVLVSFFLTAKAESASARKAYSRRSDSGDGAKKCEQKKELGAVGPANRVELVEESYAATLPIHKPTKFGMVEKETLIIIYDLYFSRKISTRVRWGHSKGHWFIAS